MTGLFSCSVVLPEHEASFTDILEVQDWFDSLVRNHFDHPTCNTHRLRCDFNSKHHLHVSTISSTDRTSVEIALAIQCRMQDAIVLVS